MTPELLPEDFPKTHGWRNLAEGIYKAALGESPEPSREDLRRASAALQPLFFFFCEHGTQAKGNRVYVHAPNTILSAAIQRSTGNKVAPSLSPK